MSDLHFLTLTEVAKRVQSREIGAVEVTRHMLERIERLDSGLRAYATVMAEVALSQAERADREIAGGSVRGPLHGVPIGLKDLCATEDAPTHVGSIALRNWNPDVDSTVVAKLRKAGAVFLGKLQMTEGAFAVHHPRIVPPVNPWSADHWTGASSSGSGVATAAGLCFGALGTDTGGSIRFPSHCCGVTGIKPTWGRVSRAGAFALSESLDHIGPMARSAADCAAMLGGIAGLDPDDATTVPEPVPDYVAALDQGVKGVRIGLDERYCSEEVDPAVSAVVQQAAEALRARGAEVRPITVPEAKELVSTWAAFCAVEAALAHEATFPAKKEEYGPVLGEALETGRSLSAMDYARIQVARQKFAGALRLVFEQVDLFLSPSLLTPTPTNALVETLGQEPAVADQVLRFTAPYNMSGSPTISLPGGFDDGGVPLGFQLVGPHLSERTLCRAGHAYQQETDWHLRHPALAM